MGYPARAVDPPGDLDRLDDRSSTGNDISDNSVSNSGTVYAFGTDECYLWLHAGILID